jgi:hypothetical protein
MKTILFSMLLSAAACGGGGSKAKPETTPTPTEATPVAKTEAPPEEAKPAPPPEEKKPDPEAIKKEALATETAAYEKAKPVFEGACKSCHFKGQKNASAKKLAEFDITTYPFAGKHANAKDIRTALAIGGGKATMPKTKPGSVKGDDPPRSPRGADAGRREAAGAHLFRDEVVTLSRTGRSVCHGVRPRARAQRSHLAVARVLRSLRALAAPDPLVFA